MKRIAACLALGWLWMTGCSSDSAEEPEPAGDSGVVPSGGKPLSADAFCTEVAKLVCSANESCCESSSSGLPDSGASSWPEGGTDAGPSVSCHDEQVAACRGSIGELVEDPRTGYVPAKGGAILEALQAAGEGCWEKPVSYTSVTEVFQGTGDVGTNCTPDDSSAQALLLSSLSCRSGSSCRLYLKSDGAPLGVCEARTDDSCSHRFDCPAGNWCDLPAGWKPGMWGECHPLRTEGWSCSSDLECASSYCDAAKRCAPPSARRYCLNTPYRSEVETDSPLLYLRLNESAGATLADISEQGHSGERHGDPEAKSPGALEDDPDQATQFDGVDDRIVFAPGTFTDSSQVSVEFWFLGGEAMLGRPLVAFGDAEVGGPIVSIDGEGSLKVIFGDTLDNAHVLSSGEVKPAFDAWHHVVVTYDGLKGALYLDGKLVASLENAFTPRLSGALHVGFSAPESYFAGAIDEVAVYGSALTESRALEHYRIGKNGPKRTWPVYQWFK